jgi:CubicO group peptidase (beta-lactamase class C family)
MARVLAHLLAVLALACLPRAHAAELPFAEVDALARAELAQDDRGGIVIGVVEDGELVWSQAYGHADTEGRVPMTTGAVFRIGSITKQFTALMLVQLVERGAVKYDDPVVKYVPEFAQVQGAPGYAQQVTLLQLATQTSGLDRNPDDDRLVYGRGPIAGWEEKLIGTLPLTGFVHPPGTRYFYSNIGYAVLGLALSRAAKEPYLDYVPAHLLAPLGMRDSGFVLDAAHEARRARGWLIENGTADAEEPERQQRDGGGWRVPNGAMYSTLADLARFVAWETGHGPDGVLPDAVRVRHFERLGSAFSELDYGYGVGFQARRRGEVVGIGHDGVLAGYQCSAWFDPKSGLGVVTLTTRREQMLGLRALALLAAAAPSP